MSWKTDKLIECWSHKNWNWSIEACGMGQACDDDVRVRDEWASLAVALDVKQPDQLELI